MTNKNNIKTVTIFGSTGSIGVSTVELLLNMKDKFQVEVLTSNVNARLLAKQAIELNAKHAVIRNSDYYDELVKLLSGTDIKTYCGEDSIVEVAKINVDITVGAIVGSAGIEPLFESIKHGNIIALANKESLVCAGDIFMSAIEQYNTTLIPVDSEHSAIYQVLESNNLDKIDNITLTASGRSF